MKKSLLIIVIALFVFSAMAQKIEISPEIIPGLTGQEITVSVLVSEFDTEATSLGAIEFYIDFDNSVLSYTGATNFSALMPVSQWFYSNPAPSLNRFACNWAEPTLQNVNIPTGTVLFDLKFLCANGQTTIDFDSAASVFVHIDGVNFVSLPVDFADGFVQINVGLEEQKQENYFLATGNKMLVIRNIEGMLTVTNLMGQNIVSAVLEGTGEHYIPVNKTGIFIVRVTNKHEETVRKVLIY
jgi:hypothetical protein